MLGYDIFISYRRSDGSAYAEKLWRDLKAAGIAPFLDRDETPGGAQLTPSLMRALRRSRMLLVLLTPDVLDSEWVQQEVETFSCFRGRAIVPVNIDNYIGRHNLDGTRLARLKDYSWIEETREGLESGVPSETVLAEINRGFRKVRVRSISRFITLAVMAGLALAALIAYAQMRTAQRETEVALAAQTAAQAELIRTQDHSQLDLATALAVDSLQRNPSQQAEQVVRAGLESLPIRVAAFQTAGVSRIAFAPDGKNILTLNKDSRKSSVYAFSGTAREWFACPPAQVCTIALAAGAAAVATAQPGGGATIRVVGLPTGAVRAAFDWESIPATLELNTSADRIAGINSEGKACVWTLPKPGQPVCVDGPANASWQLNTNGKLLASRWEDERDDENVTWTVWNTETGAEVERTGGRLHMSPTGKYTVATSGNTQVRVHNLMDGSWLPDFQHEDSVNGIAFNADDRVMATSSSSYRLRMWMFETERPEAPIVTAVAATHRTLRGFTADGMGLITEAGNPRGGTDILFWRLRVRDRLIDLVPKQRIHHDDDVYDVAEHTDGTTYATLDSKGVVQVWNTHDGNLVSLQRLEKRPEDDSPAQVCSVTGWRARWRAFWPLRGQASAGPIGPKDAYAVDPCGRHYAMKTSGSGGRDPELVTLHETATRREVARIENSANVNSVAFSTDGRYVVIGGEDHAIKVWDLEQNRLASYIEMETEVLRARISDDGRHIIAVGGKDAYETYPLATYLWQQRDLLEAMNARQIRSLSPAEWIRFLGSRVKPVRRPPP